MKRILQFMSFQLIYAQSLLHYQHDVVEKSWTPSFELFSRWEVSSEFSEDRNWTSITLYFLLVILWLFFIEWTPHVQYIHSFKNLLAIQTTLFRLSEIIRIWDENCFSHRIWHNLLFMYCISWTAEIAQSHKPIVYLLVWRTAREHMAFA